MKKLISIFVVVAMIFAMTATLAVGTSAETQTVDVWDGSIATGFAGGSGSENDPYLISTGAQLAYLAQQVNSGVGIHAGAYVNQYFKLTNSINLNWKAWTPIGYLEAGSQSASCFFGGIFDGCGYTIYNLSAKTYRGPSGTANILQCGTGLFGALRTDNAMVKNIGFEGGAVICSGGMGGVVVGILGGKADVENCYVGSSVQAILQVSGSSNTNYGKLGGIVGQVAGIDSTIKDCVNYCKVTDWGTTGWSGENACGGICGDVKWSSDASIKANISNCYFVGQLLKSSNLKSGALLGTQRKATVTVDNCHIGGVVVDKSNPANTYSGIVMGFYSEGGNYNYNNITVYKGEYVGNGVTYQNTTFTYSVTSLVGAGDAAVGDALSGVTKITNDTLVVPCAPYEKFINATERGTSLYTVEKYEDISAYRAESGYVAPEKANMVFAGWYADVDCTEAIAPNVKDGVAYAKFVSESVLSVRVQLKENTTLESENTNIRLITTVDSLNYSKVGFSITYGEQTVDKLSNTVYSRIIAMGEDYLPTSFSEVSTYFATYSFTSVPNSVFDDIIRVVPMYVTLDGTVVSGVACEITINGIIAKSN